MPTDNEKEIEAFIDALFGILLPDDEKSKKSEPKKEEKKTMYPEAYDVEEYNRKDAEAKKAAEEKKVADKKKMFDDMKKYESYKGSHNTCDCCKPVENKQSKKFDDVDSPKHYTSGNIECIDACREATRNCDGYEGALVFNIIKYVWRHKMKGKPIQDLSKARFYLNRLIEYEEKNVNLAEAAK